MNTAKNHSDFTPRFGEFPDLLFGERGNARLYFDATHFLRAMNLDPEPLVTKFQDACACWIDRLGEAYAIPKSELFIIDSRTGHQLAEEALSLLFLSYIDPPFGVYWHESMRQMLSEGVVCSDTYLLEQVRGRFTHEELSSIFTRKAQ